jgi:hypothetical protein
MTKGKSEFDLEDRLIDFSVRIIRTSESLPKSKVGKHIAGLASLFVVEHHQRLIMVKHKARNPDLTLYIR